MEVKLKLKIKEEFGEDLEVELTRNKAKELYEFLHEMFGTKTRTEYVSWGSPWWNQPYYYTSGYSNTCLDTSEITPTDGAEWATKSGSVVASFIGKD